MKYVIVATLVTALGACANQPATQTWTKPAGGGSQAELTADDGQCKAQAFSVPGANSLQVTAVFNACMQGKGWARQ